MKDRVHFFSADDLSVSHYLQMAEKVIAEYENGKKAEDINDYLELYHICLFVENKIYPREWDENRIKYIEGLHKELAIYFKALTSGSWPQIYKKVEFGYAETFFEALDRYNATACIDENSLRSVFANDSNDLLNILHIKRIVDKKDRVIASLFRDNKYAAEWLLTAYVEDNKSDRKETIHIPSSLSLLEKETIILEYVNSADANLNYVRLVLVAKNIPNQFVLSSKTRLQAQKRERELNDLIFSSDRTNITPIRYAICMSDDADAKQKWSETDKDGFPVLHYSAKFMLSMSDADLIHYCRYIFEMMTRSGFINLVSRESDSGVLERVAGLNGKNAYMTNMAFNFNQAISLMQTYAMEKKLSEVNRSIESAIKYFYETFLKEQFGYPSLPMTLSTQGASWIEKIRGLLPELDSIAHQYELYVENGEIDKDLLELSSPFILTGVKSVVEKRYYTVIESPGELKYLFHLFFGDQCMLSFVEPHKEKHYHNFFDLLYSERVIPYDNYHDYQKRDLEYLLEKKYIETDSNGNIHLSKPTEVLIMKQLYEYGACSYWLYDDEGRRILDDMESKGWLRIDNHLLTEKERDYFSYYLNNEKFTNGPALRNKYAHGVIGGDPNDLKHENSYYRLLNILILLLLKIEEDLTIKGIKDNILNRNTSNQIKDGKFVLGEIADILTVEEYHEALARNEIEKERQFVRISSMFGLGVGYALANHCKEDSEGIIILLKEPIEADYVAFCLNASPVRMIISKRSESKNYRISKQDITGLSFEILDTDQYAACCTLENFLIAVVSELNAVSEPQKREYRAICNMLRDLRDMILFEMLTGNFFKDNGISVLDSWTNMLGNQDDVSDDKILDWVHSKFDELLEPGNIVMDNMKKAHILCQRVAQPSNNE